MKKQTVIRSFLTISLGIMSAGIFAQNNVGIGTTTPDNSAILDLTATNKGLLVPRMDSLSRIAIAAPIDGLLVYDTDYSCFYYYNGPRYVMPVQMELQEQPVQMEQLELMVLPVQTD